MNTADLDLFIRTADSGSITRAAEQLDISTAAASAALKRLEKQLNVQLFIRSTRQLRLTSEGERFLVHCRAALESLEVGKDSIHALQGKVAGEIRMSAPSDVGRNVLLPWIDEMMDEHPELSINLTLGDSLSDFYLDRVDCAIRYGTPEDSSMVAFELAKVERIICASPQYVKTYGAPNEPDELKNHNCLIYQLSNRLYDHWEFSSNKNQALGQYKVRVTSNRTSNDSDLVRRWAVSGKGIAFKSYIDVFNDIQAGRLMRLLPDYGTPDVVVNLICPTRKQITPAVLLMRDFFREKLRAVSS
ncbi:LysR family transcriptional regulator [Litoribacillus peritrichatus]|uniref:LysR family transcriptional regulator n=1 Tax=Litoribacillus peritrichatus TaxID=718191 RepID=A0ABP7N5J5_9GAMM